MLSTFGDLSPGVTTSIFRQQISQCNILVSNLLALLTDLRLALHINLGGSSRAVTLPVGLDVLDELGDTEEVIHLLERQTLGLGNEEPDEGEHEEAEGAIDKEGAITVSNQSTRNILQKLTRSPAFRL